MNKWFFLAGIVVTSVLIFNFNSGDIGTSDILSLMDTTAISEELPQDDTSSDFYIYGAILPPDLELNKKIAEFFHKLEKKQDIKNFIIIGEGKSTLDLFSPSIQKYFPTATISETLLKGTETDEEMTAIAKNIGPETFVVAAVTFTEYMDKRTASFHDELAENAIKGFDENMLTQVDVKNKSVLKTFFDYLALQGAKKVDIQKHIVFFDRSYFIATFEKGEPIENDDNLTILAFGDMMLGRYVRVFMDDYGKDYIFENIKGADGKFFKGANVIFGNLEGPVTSRGTKGGTSMVFDFNEDIVPFLKSYGFNLFSITNNHAVDQGWDGRDSTISTFDNNGLGWCGHPSDVDPNSVYYGQVGDKSFAFICFQDITFHLDDEAAINLVKAVRPTVDYLIVSIHWGVEYQHKPNFDLQVSPGRAFIDAGADFVIGHHPHVVESFEKYNGKFIFYSLGNFVFDQYWSQMTQEELAIGIVLDDADDESGLKTKVYLFPMKSEKSQSRLLTDDEYSKWIEEFIGYGDYDEETKEEIRRGVIDANF